MKKTYRIPDMQCMNCVKVLESLGDELDGLLSIRACLDNQLLEVEFDETVLAEDELLSAIKILEFTPIPE